MRILSWNVNGLRALYKKGLFWESLHDWDPDVICLQETKSTLEQLPLEISQMPDYNSHFFWPEFKKGYSGVAVYSKSLPLSVQNGIGNSAMDNEGRVIVADYGEFLLANVYFPNGRSSPERLDYKMRFYDAFLGYISNLKSSGRRVIFCGDVNTAHKPIDLARPKANEHTSGFLEQERAWIDKLELGGFVDIFRDFNKNPEQYTYWDTISRARERNVGWRIDYFFVDEELKPHVKNCFILPQIFGSDHCPVVLDIDL